MHDPDTWSRILNFLNLDHIPFPILSKPSNAGLGERELVDPLIREYLSNHLDTTYSWVSANLGISWS